MFRKTIVPIVVVIATALAPWAASADPYSTDFEDFSLGLVDLQQGWSSFGSAGSGCKVYDVEVVDSTGYGIESFGTQSLRISNAVTSGCFSDQTFTASSVDSAGEPDATFGAYSSAPVHNAFVAEWEFASTVPDAEQPKLSVVASADRGDGARMTWVQMADTPDGVAVNFFDYVDDVEGEGGCDGEFVFSEVASGLDRAVPHSIRTEVILHPGRGDDVVRVFVDGVLSHTGTTWEDYFRDCEPGGVSRTVDSTLFRVGGSSCPGVHCNGDLEGLGFLIDNYSQTTADLVGTELSATPAIADLSGPELHLLQLSATLTGDGAPIAGAPVEFSAQGVSICTSTTGADGVATCDATGNLLEVVLVAGYSVDYAGDGFLLLPSSARAGLLAI